MGHCAHSGINICLNYPSKTKVLVVKNAINLFSLKSIFFLFFFSCSKWITNEKKNITKQQEHLFWIINFLIIWRATLVINSSHEPNGTFFHDLLRYFTNTVRPSCLWQFCIFFEQEQRKDYKISLLMGTISPWVRQWPSIDRQVTSGMSFQSYRKLLWLSS